ncbi:MAG: PD40 domain-containing protein [Acidobacteria bacterium]|nr:PD40 domain-containing protein [Acidobacteriota bacterium]
MSKQAKQLYEFGRFRLDADERLLMRDGRTVPLSPKVFDTLLALVENSGRILGKEELMQLLWPDTFVEESNLTQNISQLRRALSDGNDDVQYIETIPKRGYRFAADVKPVEPLNGQQTEPVADGKSDWQFSANGNPTNGHQSLADSSPVQSTSEAVEVSEPLLSRKRAAMTMALLAISLLILALALWVAYRRLNNHGKIAFRQISPTKLTTSGKALLATISRDGKYAAFVAEDQGRQSLWVRQVAADSSSQILAPAEMIFSGVTFSLDDTFLYYVARPRGELMSKLYQVPLLGGTPREVMDDVDSPVTFSPNGQYFAFVRNFPQSRETALILAKLDGSEDRTLLKKKRPESLSLLGPAWSPDGRVIACSAGTLTSGEVVTQVVAVSIEDGSVRPIGDQTWTTIGQIAWLGDGSGLVFSAWRRTSAVYGDQLYLLTYPKGEMRRVTDDMTSYEGISVSADSGLLVSRRSDRISSIWVVPERGGVFDASAASQIKSGFGDNYSERLGLDWTPDGRLLFAAHASGNLDVWSTSSDGKQQRQLTRDGQADLMPVSSPDGRYVLFVSERGGSSHIWRMDADGGNPKQLTRGRGDVFPSVSPDGRWVVYSSSTNGKSALWKVAIDGGEPVQLSPKVMLRPVLSPDGKWIASFYQDEKDGRNKIALSPFEGGEPVIIEGMPVPDFALLRWSPDGKSLTYIATEHGASNIWSKPIDGGQARRLTNFPSDQIFRFAWSRDGKTLACERGMVINDAVLLRSVKAE